MLAPLVSLVVCVFNGERYLSLTLDSIIAQTYSNIEILVVDDGSRDASLEIIKEYAARDERIRWFTRVNSGLPSARNFAFSEAKGQWIAVIDQDDLCYPERIQEQLSVAARFPSAGLVFCDTDHIDSNGVIVCSHLKSYVLPEDFIPSKSAANLLLSQGCFVDSEAWFIQRRVVQSLDPLVDGLRYACDYEYFIRVGLQYDFAYTRKKLAAWRMHPDQESSKNKKRFYEYRVVLRRYVFRNGIEFLTRFRIILNLIRSHLGEIYRWSKSN